MATDEIEEKKIFFLSFVRVVVVGLAFYYSSLLQARKYHLYRTRLLREKVILILCSSLKGYFIAQRGESSTLLKRKH